MWLLVAIALLGGCQSCREIGGGAGLDLPYFEVVYQCSDDGDRVWELCFYGDAEELADRLAANSGGAWSCGPTPRHLGPCIHCCGPDCGRGCNAFQGCYCQ